MTRTNYGVFRYLSADNALLYREVMRVFVRAKERFVVTLRPEEVSDALEGAHAEAVPAALGQLEQWGNIRSDPDTSRVTTVADFQRARVMYQFTPEGENAERALGDFDRRFGEAGRLQSAALDDIVVQLRALADLQHDDPLDEGKVSLALSTLSARFENLAANAQGFAGSLRRTIDLRGIEEDAFLVYKETLIEYLDRFVQDLLVRTGQIADLIQRLTSDGAERLLAAAADRDRRDDAPDAPPIDHLAVWQERWRGFREWFVGTPTNDSQSVLLRRMARTAIPDLLRAATAINDRRSGRSDRAADFRTLALWFAEAPDDPAMHRLARVAFGLAPARHLSIDADTLAARELEPVPPATPWAAAPPLVISPRLRATGSWERRGAPARVRDRAAEKRAIALALEERQAALDAVRGQLLTDGPVPLDELRVRSPEALQAFLGLVGQALGRRRGLDEAVRLASLDGAFVITLQSGPAEPLVTLDTESGRLAAPRHLIGIEAAS